MSKEDREKKIEEKTKEDSGKQEKRPSAIREENLVRIASTDVPGNKRLLAGMTRIKGVSWSFSNAMCRKLGIDKNKKISELSKEEIEKIVGFLKNPDVPLFMLNRRKDLETGEDKHLIGVELDIQKDFDIKRLKKIRSYRGLRHALGQPTRGQRTKSHFRKAGKKKAVGVHNKPKAAKK